MNSGWIKLHRKLIDNPIWKKSNYVAVWIYLLLNANHKEKTIIWNNKKTVIKEGSFIGSIQKIAEYYGMSKGTVSYILDYFISEHMIEKKSTSKFTVFTIINWSKYQIVEHKTEHKLNTSKTQAEHKLKQPIIYDNDKKEKNDKKKDSAKAVVKVNSNSIITNDKDIIANLINRFCLSYKNAFGFDYMNNNNGKDRSAIGKLLASYKKLNPAAKTEQCLNDFTALFNAICLTDYGKDTYHAEIDISKIGSHINQYIQIINKNNINNEKRYNAIFG